MRKNESIQARLWAIGLGVATITAALLAVHVNPFEISLAYLALLVGVVAVGLATNLGGGLAASAVGVFAVILINQYAGIYPREDRILNIASELAVFLLVGPLAGSLAEAIERVQRQADYWLARAEAETVHDDTFGTLKPEWSKARLEEEILRAKCFSRPLSIMLLQIEPEPGASSPQPAELRARRIAALQAVIRLARAATQPPTVVAYAGGDQVLVLLPEHTPELAGQVAANLQKQAAGAVYFPEEASLRRQLDDKSIGNLLSQLGRLQVGIAGLDAASDSSELLLERAKSSLR